MALSRFVVLVVLIAAASAKVAKFYSCPDIVRDHCTVSKVRINPCPVSTRCLLKKGRNATISFDFTPNFVTSNLQTAVYWPDPNGVEKPFSEMNSDACSLTTCPTVSGASQTATYNLYIGKKLPKGVYRIRWKVWNGDDTDQKCCFESVISIPASKVDETATENENNN